MIAMKNKIIVELFVCLLVCLSPCLFVCLFVSLVVCLSVLFVCLIVCLFACLLVCLFAFLSFYFDCLNLKMTKREKKIKLSFIINSCFSFRFVLLDLSNKARFRSLLQSFAYVRAHLH